MSEVIDVVIPSTIDQTFSYRAAEPLAPGQRVAVPFGRANRLTEAFVVACPSLKEHPYKLKSVKKVIDHSTLLTDGQWQLAAWLSRYYVYPLADILKAMIPGALTQQDDLALTPEGLAAVQKLRPLQSLKKKRREQLLGLCPQPDQALPILTLSFAQPPLPSEVTALAQSLGPEPEASALEALAEFCGSRAGQSQLALALTFVRKPILRAASVRAKLSKVAADWGIPADELLAGWHKAGLVTQHTELGSAADRKGSDSKGPDAKEAPEPPKELTPRQQEVFGKLKDYVAVTGLGQVAPEPVLLHGITGSGKTELYLQLIAELKAHHPAGQTLVLVPEIGLTPQMETRFENRFPGEVALVHSALSGDQRWQRLAAVASGQRSILIGPRSAVLAGFADLKLLIVDEEHDSSYKQGTGFLYHGRDVAIVRAMQQKAAVVLGSATPSLESYQNALAQRYRYLPLLERATGLNLPAIKVIKGLPAFSVRESVSQQGAKECYVPISPAILAAMRERIAAGQQVIVIVNRKGYSCYLMTKAEKEPVCCPHCAITLKVYNHNALLRCHYCDYRIPVTAFLRKNPEKEYLSVGYGSDKVYDYLVANLPEAQLAAVDADTPKKEFYQSLHKFRAGQVDVLVGTQILAKGHDFPKVTLTVVLEIDHLLNLPDFRGGERTFQLLVQAAGRSGRDKLPGEVLFQTLQPGHPVIQAALSQDYLPFAKAELDMRQDLGFPPFARLITVEFHTPKPGELALCQARTNDALAAIAAEHPQLQQQITVSGPSAPPIEKVRGRYRLILLLRSSHTRPLWQMVHLLRGHLDRARLPSSVARKIDVDPQSLL